MRDGERLAKKGNRVQRKMRSTLAIPEAAEAVFLKISFRYYDLSLFRIYVGVAGLVVVVFSGVHAADRSKSRKVIFDIEVMASQFTSRMTRCMFHLAKDEWVHNAQPVFVDIRHVCGECAGSSTQIYKIEKAKTGRGLVHIKFWYNNKYLVRWSPNHYWIAATADKPEEDKCKWSCTLFEILPIDGQTIRFRHVQLGHYACLWRLGCHNVYDSCLFAGGKGVDKDKCDVCTIYVGHILKDGTHSGVNPCKFNYETKEEKLAAASNLIEQLATEAI
ncbi:hypothetical protein LguiB_018433 [Lonicera macranthoides]